MKGYIYDDVECLAEGDIMSLRIRTTPTLLKKGLAHLNIYEWDPEGELRPYNMLIAGSMDATHLRQLATAALNMAAYLEHEGVRYAIGGGDED
jgi:hypothetical protein